MTDPATPQRVVVTGAASGIGRATVARLLRNGAAVFATDRAGDVDLEVDVTAPGLPRRSRLQPRRNSEGSTASSLAPAFAST
jgi:NAD(P)-dependent dehydrogenase (short-subunit alcohol dehydrogenase family)